MARPAPTEGMTGSSTVSGEEIRLLDAYWRAANYLAVGQIYLLENPLLREPLRPEHTKPRLLGHWGTTPGLNLVYVHANRVIKARDLDAIWIVGPGHGGPAATANAYLEGTSGEVYPDLTPDERGMARLFRQFSFPGGVGSHVTPETPGSIHEGGELGYALVHAFGAAFDNPELVVFCVVGDGEAETGPLAASWHSNKFLNPVTDGSVIPILALNGYKIANPTILDRIPDEELMHLFEGYGYAPRIVRGSDPESVHRELAETFDAALDAIERIKATARLGDLGRPTWPMIILRTPKGWTGPKEVDGVPTEGTFRSHQVPMADVRTNPGRLALLETWMRSYRPEELFDECGTLRPELAALPPRGARRMSANPHANGGLLLRDLRLPDHREYAVEVERPAAAFSEATRVLGTFLRDVIAQNRTTFRLFGPDETSSNRLDAVFEVTDRTWVAETRPTDDHLAPDGRVMEVLSEHLCQGWLEGYLLTGRHGLFNCYEAFIHVVEFDVQPAREVVEDDARDPLAATDRLAQLPAEQPCLAPGPQRLQSSGPGFHRSCRQQEGRSHPRVPAAGHQHPVVGRRPLSAEPRLRQRHRRRQAAGVDVPVDGRRDRSLCPGARHLGLGQQ